MFECLPLFTLQFAPIVASVIHIPYVRLVHSNFGRGHTKDTFLRFASFSIFNTFSSFSPWHKYEISKSFSTSFSSPSFTSYFSVSLVGFLNTFTPSGNSSSFFYFFGFSNYVLLIVKSHSYKPSHIFA